MFLKLVRALKFDGSYAKNAIPKNNSTEKILAKKPNGFVLKYYNNINGSLQSKKIKTIKMVITELLCYNGYLHNTK